MIPTFVRADDVDTDRVMIAAWFVHQGEVDTGVGIARSVVGARLPVEQVEARLRDIAELLADYVWCSDDPRRFAWVRERVDAFGLEGARSWGDAQCEQILLDAQANAAALASAGLAVAS